MIIVRKPLWRDCAQPTTCDTAMNTLLVSEAIEVLCYRMLHASPEPAIDWSGCEGAETLHIVAMIKDWTRGP